MALAELAEALDVLASPGGFQLYCQMLGSGVAAKGLASKHHLSYLRVFHARVKFGYEMLRTIKRIM